MERGRREPHRARPRTSRCRTNHWEVVNFLRKYYEEYQIAPAVRVLTKAIGKQLGPEKGNSQYLYELFPYGPAKQACKIAGPAQAHRLRLTDSPGARAPRAGPRARHRSPRPPSMTAATIAYALLFYGASLVLAGGLAYRIYDYARTPAPLKIPTTPAPTTRGGVALRLAREVVLFESLFKSSLWTWAFGWLFHAGPGAGADAPPALLHRAGVGVGRVRCSRSASTPAFAMAAGLAGLWVRRFVVARVRYISTPSDHLMLALLLAIAVSGPRDEVRRAHRHRRGEGVLPRAHGRRLAAAARRRRCSTCTSRWSRC